MYTNNKAFRGLVALLKGIDGLTFEQGTEMLREYVDTLTSEEYLSVAQDIGIIPEHIDHDSSAEKYFSKASDLVLSRGFRELGMKSQALAARGNSADVIAESKYHDYSLVADAKAFRLSRTAKNQKDFKITALSSWRNDSDYAVLCSPFFQYPSSRSQIYEQALMNNVLVFSWEQLVLMIENNMREDMSTSFAPLWGWSKTHSQTVTVSDMRKSFLKTQLLWLQGLIGIDDRTLEQSMKASIAAIRERSEDEIAYWVGVIEEVKTLSRDEAIDRLLASMKIDPKISQIRGYAGNLSYE